MRNVFPRGSRLPGPPLVITTLRQELEAYLDTLTITGDNIGGIRRSCFMPWDSYWNGVVRDETAMRGVGGRLDADGPAISVTSRELPIIPGMRK